MVEPGFTRTNISQNSRIASHTLAVYAAGRDGVLNVLEENVAKGEDPASVAAVVLEALTSLSPKLRYAAGRQARLLSLLKRISPAKVMDIGLRKQFRLSDVKAPVNAQEKLR